VLYKWILGFSDGFQGSLATIDCTIMLSLMGLACIVGQPGIQTFLDIKDGTSEVLKLKEAAG